MEQQVESSQDFKPTRSDLVVEIKGEIMNLNDALSIARTFMRFHQCSKPTATMVFASVYEHLDRIVGLSRELSSKDLVKAVEQWLDDVNPSVSGNNRFVNDVVAYKRVIDQELFGLGIKDTGLRVPVPFPLEFHEEEYAEKNDGEI